MRLQAAVSLLHLSTVEVYGQAIAPKFVRLALLVQVCFYYRCCRDGLGKVFTLLHRIRASTSDTYS